MAVKRRVKRFVRDASHLSPSSLSLTLPLFVLSFPCVRRFPLHLPFSPFLFATRRYRRCLRFISANEPFRDAPAVHPRMGNNLEDKDAPARMLCLGDPQWRKKGVSVETRRNPAKLRRIVLATEFIARHYKSGGVRDYAI